MRVSNWCLAPLATLTLAACGNSKMPPMGTQGMPLTGPKDVHCISDGGMVVQKTSQTVCLFKPDGGAMSAGPTYGDTLYNTEADDDDCKYHVKYSVTPIYENYDVTFTVTASKRTDGSALTGANTVAEVYLSDTHPAPNSGQKTTETSPGVYNVGPIHFDAPGKWTIRFHFYENCYDFSDQSPHGHIAFYLQVN